MERHKKETISENTGPEMPKRILLVDDSKTIREVVAEFLESMGYNVALAIDGFEALTVFLKSSFDLVLTDLEMPVMDGLRLAGFIKEKSPCTPVILLTGSDRETVCNIRKDLVDSVLFKPFPMEDLQMEIQKMLASRARFPGNLKSDAII